MLDFFARTIATARAVNSRVTNGHMPHLITDVTRATNSPRLTPAKSANATVPGNATVTIHAAP